MQVNVKTASHAIQLAKSSRIISFLVWTGSHFQEVTPEKIYNWAVEKAKHGYNSDKNRIKEDALYAIIQDKVAK